VPVIEMERTYTTKNIKKREKALDAMGISLEEETKASKKSPSDSLS